NPFGTGDSAGRGIVIDSQGRIVAVGACPSDCGAFDFELARYNPDGALDNTFGNGGLVTTHLGDYLGDTRSPDSPEPIALDSHGRIVVAGSLAGDFALARYNSDGSLDNTFGGTQPVPMVTDLRFYPSIVKKGASYTANFSGVSLTDKTFFDVLFIAPSSNDSA